MQEKPPSTLNLEAQHLDLQLVGHRTHCHCPSVQYAAWGGCVAAARNPGEQQKLTLRNWPNRFFMCAALQQKRWYTLDTQILLTSLVPAAGRVGVNRNFAVNERMAPTLDIDCLEQIAAEPTYPNHLESNIFTPYAETPSGCICKHGPYARSNRS